ncbi:hypothetical protein BC834DRAFT_845384 [Gloeopeniophorella convolvens]|nr:hypothetical protein BC834DRAFT_845384 [Gloeopeniophorella convolvens]
MHPSAYDLQRTLSHELVTFYQSTAYRPSDFIAWQEEEAAFLASAKRKEPVQISLEVAYIEALEKTPRAGSHADRLSSVQYERLQEDITALDPFVTITAEQYGGLSANDVQDGKHEALDRKRRLLMGRLDRASKAVEDAERLLGVKEPWTYADAKYTKTLEYISNRHFVHTIEKLQGLVQKPPRPLLLYSKVVEYCNLSEFEILKYTDDSMLRKPWALRSNREAANKYFKLERAKEELVRCSVEAHRLHAWVNADDDEMAAAVQAYEAFSPAFASHLKTIQANRQWVNDSLRERLSQLYAIRGERFNPRKTIAEGASPNGGRSMSPAVPPGTPQPREPDGSALDRVPPASSADDDMDDGEDVIDDEEEDELLRITDALARIMYVIVTQHLEKGRKPKGTAWKGPIRSEFDLAIETRTLLFT